MKNKKKKEHKKFLNQLQYFDERKKLIDGRSLIVSPPFPPFSFPELPFYSPPIQGDPIYPIPKNPIDQIGGLIGSSEITMPVPLFLYSADNDPSWVNGNTVSNLVDQSGNGNNTNEPATSTNHFTYGQNITFGHKNIYLAGSCSTTPTTGFKFNNPLSPSANDLFIFIVLSTCFVTNVNYLVYDLNQESLSQRILPAYGHVAGEIGIYNQSGSLWTDSSTGGSAVVDNAASGGMQLISYYLKAGETQKGYVNGVLKVTGDVSPARQWTDTYLITGTASVGNLRGNIYEIRIYNNLNSTLFPMVNAELKTKYPAIP